MGDEVYSLKKFTLKTVSVPPAALKVPDSQIVKGILCLFIHGISTHLDSFAGSKDKGCPLFFQFKNPFQIFVIGNMPPIDSFHNTGIFPAEPGVQEMHSLWFSHIVPVFRQYHNQPVTAFCQGMVCRNRIRDPSVIIESAL